jgi:hypothetical protein
MACDDGDPNTSDDTCQAGVCVGLDCTPTESSELSCDDGVDNDCDLLVDCADPDCVGQPCDDADPHTKADQCSSAGVCEGQPCTDVWVCDQCGTGQCHDVLIHEDPGCGCANPVAAPNCNVGTTYNVDCGGGYHCTYERREITQDCNCRWECQ